VNTPERLLVLDDDLAIGRTIASIAESASMSVRVTTGHVEFFRQVESWQLSHIALDLVMPEMDAVQVLGKLAEMQCDARIIITSGVGHRVLEAAGHSATEHGLNIIGVISKPFLPSA
jgi:CheY-like chemotaxis protein